MLSLPSSVKIYLFEQSVDMRKGFDGLAALVRSSGLDVFSGHLFVFLSKRADRVKILTFERGGYVLWYKRLEQGKFRRPASQEGQTQVMMEPSQLTLLLEGMDFTRVKRPKRWEPRAKELDKSFQI